MRPHAAADTAVLLCVALWGAGSWVEGLELLPESNHDFVVGDHVTWTKVDKDVPSGNIGTVVRAIDDGYIVKFLKGQWGFKADQLRKMDFVVGDHVTWKMVDAEVPAGTVGIVKRLAGDGLVVQFPNGKWLFNPNSLRLASPSIATTTTAEVTYESSKVGSPTIASDFAMGDKVVWSRVNADVPQGSIGTVVRITDSTVVVRFRKGQWAFDPDQMHKVGLHVGELVTWTREDKDVPKGSIGVVEAFGVSGALVHFPGKRWLFNPDQLRESFASTSTTSLPKTSTLAATIAMSTEEMTSTTPAPTSSTATSTQTTQTSTRTSTFTSSTATATSTTLTTGTRTSTSTEKSSSTVTSTTTAQVSTAHVTKAAALDASAFAIGQRVIWKKEDNDIPRGSIGTVVRRKGADVLVVQFPKGRWGFRIDQLLNAPAEEEDDSKGGFCCFAAQDESSDVCGTCHSSGRAEQDSFCGRSRKGCSDCGGLAWCNAPNSGSSAITQVLMRKDSAGAGRQSPLEDAQASASWQAPAGHLLWLSLPTLLLTAAAAFALARRRLSRQPCHGTDVCGQPLVYHMELDDVEG